MYLTLIVGIQHALFNSVRCKDKLIMIFHYYLAAWNSVCSRLRGIFSLFINYQQTSAQLLFRDWCHLLSLTSLFRFSLYMRSFPLDILYYSFYFTCNCFLLYLSMFKLMRYLIKWKLTLSSVCSFPHDVFFSFEF